MKALIVSRALALVGAVIISTMIVAPYEFAAVVRSTISRADGNSTHQVTQIHEAGKP